MQFITSGDRIAVENFTIGDLYTITFVGGTNINTACIGKGADFVTFQRNLPELLFSLTMETAELVSSIDLYAGGTGTNNYNDLMNKPQINDVELVGNKSLSDLGIQPNISDLDTIRSGAAAGATAVQPAALSDYQPIIDSSHKLDADLVDDTTATHKFATAAQLSQIEINENNISLLEQMNGAKNHFDNKARTSTANNVTFTVQNDKSIKVTSTGAASALSLIFLYGSNIAYATNIYKNMVLCGSPSIVGSSTCFYRVLYSNNGVSQVKYDDIVSTSGYTIDDTYDYIKILIVCSSGYDAGEEGVIFKPMIIDSSMYNAGFTDYQPYAMSNAELTAAIQALQAQLANQ